MTEAGYSHSSNQNIFIGYAAGQCNVGIGYAALCKTTTGTHSQPLGLDSWYEEINYEISDWIGLVRKEINNWLEIEND